MEKELLEQLIICIDNLETSLDTDEWIYIYDDLLALRNIYSQLNNTDNEFYKQKYLQLIDKIAFIESEAQLFLRKQNIII